MNIFTIDWDIFLRDNLPIALRRDFYLHFIRTVFAEITHLYTSFLIRKDQWNYRIEHSPQVIHIEAVLNDAFDSVERRIYIENVTFQEFTHLWPDGENPHFLQEENANPDQPLYLLEDGAGLVNPDATVFVPIALKPLLPLEQQNFESRIKVAVDAYKPYGVTYQILYYE